MNDCHKICTILLILNAEYRLFENIHNNDVTVYISKYSPLSISLFECNTIAFLKSGALIGHGIYSWESLMNKDNWKEITNQ